MIGMRNDIVASVTKEAGYCLESLSPKEFGALTSTIAGVAENLREPYPECKTLKVLTHFDRISSVQVLTGTIERLMVIATQGAVEEDFLQQVLNNLELAYYRFAEENPQIIEVLATRPEIVQLLPEVFAGFVPFLAGKIDDTIQAPEKSFEGVSPFQKLKIKEDGNTYTSDNSGWCPCP